MMGRKLLQTKVFKKSRSYKQRSYGQGNQAAKNGLYVSRFCRREGAEICPDLTFIKEQILPAVWAVEGARHTTTSPNGVLITGEWLDCDRVLVTWCCDKKFLGN
jgi:hypothetical protein